MKYILSSILLIFNSLVFCQQETLVLDKFTTLIDLTNDVISISTNSGSKADFEIAYTKFEKSYKELFSGDSDDLVSPYLPGKELSAALGNSLEKISNLNEGLVLHNIHASLLSLSIISNNSEINNPEFLQHITFLRDYLLLIKTELKSVINTFSQLENLPAYLKVVDFSVNYENPELQTLSLFLTNLGKLPNTQEASISMHSLGDVIFNAADTFKTIGIINSGDTIELLFNFKNVYRGFHSLILIDFENVDGKQQEVVIDKNFDYRRQFHLLSSGWNLISFYIEPDFIETKKLFEEISDQVIKIKDENKSYDPTLPDHLNTLTSIEKGKGYWVKVKSNIDLTTGGSILNSSSTAIGLITGWNLIAFPDENAKNISVALETIIDKVMKVKNTSKSFDPKLPDFLNTLKELKPGEGYWIKVSENCELTF